MTTETEKKTRRPNGNPRPYERKDGMWCIAIELPSDGTKRRRKVIAKASKADVIAEYRKEHARLEKVGDLITSHPTLETWLNLWLSTIASKRLKPRTHAGYSSTLRNYVIPSIGRVRLDKLKTSHVRQMHDYVLAKEKDKGSRLSSTTALQAHRVLSSALSDAVRDDRVGRNVASLTPAPRAEVSKRTALTAAEARTLLRSANGKPEAARWWLALLTGMRQGECLGLTREAVDFTTGIITVSWQLQRLTWQHGCGKQGTDKKWPCGKARGGSCPDRHVPIPAGMEAERVHGGLWLMRPKSKKGWRQIPMAPPLRIVLKRHLASADPGMSGLVFAAKREEGSKGERGGRPIDPAKDSLAWDTACRTADVPDVPLHSARHTCATLLYELGVPEQTRIQILGHSSATTTAGYTHISTPMMVDAMDQLGALLSPTE